MPNHADNNAYFDIAYLLRILAQTFCDKYNSGNRDYQLQQSTEELARLLDKIVSFENIGNNIEYSITDKSPN